MTAILSLSRNRFGPAAPEGPPADDKLRAYHRLKLDLAAQIRSLREAVRMQGDERRINRCEAIMVKLAEDRFTLAVVGQFKRGKSSLMNGIIGRELLPVGVLPLTSAITVLRYGPSERLLIQRRHWTILEEKPLERLADYVTERGNPGNRQQVSAAYLELPNSFLRRGLEFVDTPGIGSSIEANTATTYGFLPQCDAVLLVTSADAPLNRVELEFLCDVHRHAAKMFIVLNKVDLLEEAERTDVLEFVRATLREQAGITAPRIFPVSALQGLTAKQRGDDALFARCGLAELESALAEFLTHQKAAVFLASILAKTEPLLRAAQMEDEIGWRARQAPSSIRPEQAEKLDHEFQRLAAAREEILERVRAQFLQNVRAAAARAIDPFLKARKDALPRFLTRLLRHSRLYLGRPLSRRFAVAVCRILDRSALHDLWPRLSQNLSASALGSDPEQRRLASNLGGIARAAAALHGITPAEDDDADLLPPMRDPGTHLSGPESSLWEPRLPSSLAWLPARWRTVRLAEELVGYANMRLAKWRYGLDQAVSKAAEQAFHDWANDVQTMVTSLESRVHPSTARRKTQIQTESRATFAAIGENLVRLREEIARINGEEAPAPPVQREVAPRQREKEQLRLPAHRADRKQKEGPETIGADLGIRGCPVCAHLARVNSDFLSKWQYDLFSNESVQGEFAGELGFCSRHQWQLEAISSPIGMSVGQAKLVRRVGNLLAEAAQQPAGERALEKLAPGNRPCRVCQLQEEEERNYMGQLAAFVRQAAGQEAYARSQGLCLRHLAKLVAALPDEASHFVLACAGKRWGELAEDMESYGMKTEALRRQLRNSDEEDAYWRANVLLAGSRSLCLPWPKEDFL